MRRVVVLGRGGAGKSTFAARLGARTGLPVVELDTMFWFGSTPTAPGAWVARQHELVARPAWILDGDLGPFDVLDVRLRAADTVVLLDLSLARCAWRAARRSREDHVFWWWVLTYRRRWRPRILDAVRSVAPGADLHILQTPRAVEAFLGRLL